MAAEVDFGFGCKPAEAEFRAVGQPPGKRRLGKVHLGCNVLHPPFLGGFRKDADSSGVARVTALGEGVDLSDANTHGALLDGRGRWGRCAAARRVRSVNRCDGSRLSVKAIASMPLLRAAFARSQWRNRNSLELISTQPRSSMPWRMSFAGGEVLGGGGQLGRSRLAARARPCRARG